MYGGQSGVQQFRSGLFEVYCTSHTRCHVRLRDPFAAIEVLPPTSSGPPHLYARVQFSMRRPTGDWSLSKVQVALATSRPLAQTPKSVALGLRRIAAESNMHGIGANRTVKLLSIQMVLRTAP